MSARMRVPSGTVSESTTMFSTSASIQSSLWPTMVRPCALSARQVQWSAGLERRGGGARLCGAGIRAADDLLAAVQHEQLLERHARTLGHPSELVDVLRQGSARRTAGAAARVPRLPRTACPPATRCAPRSRPRERRMGSGPPRRPGVRSRGACRAPRSPAASAGPLPPSPRLFTVLWARIHRAARPDRPRGSAFTETINGRSEVTPVRPASASQVRVATHGSTRKDPPTPGFRGRTDHRTSLLTLDHGHCPRGRSGGTARGGIS